MTEPSAYDKASMLVSRNLGKAADELARKGEFSLHALHNLHAQAFRADARTSLDVVVEVNNYAGLRPARDDWQKTRDFGRYYPPHTTFYSGLEAQDIKNAETAIIKARPENMRNLSNDEKITRLAAVYAELDYLHSFNDGNSRVNRVFVGQMAIASGIDLDYSLIDRTEMYAARDKSLARFNLERRPAELLKRIKCPYYLNALEGIQESIGQLGQHFPGVDLKSIFMKAAQLQGSDQESGRTTPQTVKANLNANSPAAAKIRQMLQAESSAPSTASKSTYRPD